MSLAYPEAKQAPSHDLAVHILPIVPCFLPSSTDIGEPLHGRELPLRQLFG